MIKLPSFSKLSRRERFMIAAGAAALFLVLTDRLVFAPWLKYATRTRKEIYSLEDALRQQNKLFQRKPAILKDVTYYRDFLKTGQTPELEMAAFLKEMEKIAQKTGITVQEVRPLPSAALELYQEYALEVHYEAALDDWVKFVHEIAASTSLLVLDKAVLAVKEEGSDTLKGHVKVRKIVFYPPEGVA